MISPDFEKAFAHTVGLEGKWSDDPEDSGGETMYGITEKVARANGYSGPMKEMPLAVAHMIYKRQYWDLMRLDDVAKVSGKVAAELFDTGVNCGIGQAGKMLQTALNALNNGQKFYADGKIDGVIGPVTVASLKAFFTRGAASEKVILAALNALQGAFYITLALTREKDEKFVFGWLANRVAC